MPRAVKIEGAMPEAPFEQGDDDPIAPLFDTAPEEETPSETFDDLFGKEESPKHVYQREDASELLTWLWMGVGSVGIRTNRFPAGGRVMRLQSPLAGKKLDEAIVGTFLDTLIQPLVRSKSSLEDFGSLIAVPVMAEMVRKRPNGQMAQAMMMMLVESLGEMAPILKEQKLEQEAKVRAIADIGDVLGLEEGQDPMEALFSYIYGGDIDGEEDAEESAL